MIAIDDVTKLKPGMPIPSQFAGEFRFQRGPATPAEFSQIPQASEKLLDAMFNLNPGQVAVEPDRPETTFYVLTLDNGGPPVSYGRPDGTGRRLCRLRWRGSPRQDAEKLRRRDDPAPRASQLQGNQDR